MDRQCISLCAAHQTAGHLAADPRVLRKYLLLGNVFVLDILQIHLTAVDRCCTVQLSNQTANGFLAGDLSVDQTDILQLAAKGLEQARVLRCFNGQVADFRVILLIGAVIAFQVRILNGRKAPIRVKLGPVVVLRALKLNFLLLYRGGDNLILVFFLK